MQKKGFACCQSPSLAFVCLISRELKTASSGAYSPGAPIQLLPHDVPSADKNSSVLIPLQDYPPISNRNPPPSTAAMQKVFSLPLLYPLRKSSLRIHANKNSLSLIIGRFLWELTLYIKNARRMSLHRAFPFFFYQTESRSSGARYIPSPSFTPKAS